MIWTVLLHVPCASCFRHPLYSATVHYSHHALQISYRTRGAMCVYRKGNVLLYRRRIYMLSTATEHTVDCISILTLNVQSKQMASCQQWGREILLHHDSMCIVLYHYKLSITVGPSVQKQGYRRSIYLVHLFLALLMPFRCTVTVTYGITLRIMYLLYRTVPYCIVPSNAFRSRSVGIRMPLRGSITT